MASASEMATAEPFLTMAIIAAMMEPASAVAVARKMAALASASEPVMADLEWDQARATFFFLCLLWRSRPRLDSLISAVTSWTSALISIRSIRVGGPGPCQVRACAMAPLAAAVTNPRHCTGTHPRLVHWTTAPALELVRILMIQQLDFVVSTLITYLLLEY